MDFYLDRSFTIDFGTTPAEANALLLGIPFDYTTTVISGARQAPLRIREAFFQKETADLNIYDLGNLVCVPANVNETGKRVEYTLTELRKRTQKQLFVLGGEHLITYWIVRFLQPDVLIVFDAHYDMKNDVNGERYTHCTFLRRLVEETEIKVFIIGGRAFDEDEKSFIEAHKDRIFLTSEKINEICKDKKVYISVDIDVFDPAFAQGTGTPESNGLSPSQFFDILKNLDLNVIGGDIVEVNPLLDNRANTTSVLAADILFELINKSYA